jgi:hypothetical protein
MIISLKNCEHTRWRLEGRSKQHELHKSKILLRCWSHTWQKKTTKNKQKSNTPNPQPAKSFSTPCYTEKQGLPHCQTLAPNLPERCRPTGEQISSTHYSHSHLWDKPAWSPGQIDSRPAKKKTLNSKQGTEKDKQQRGKGALSTLETGEVQGAALHANFQ